MTGAKVKKFMQLAGQLIAERFNIGTSTPADEHRRKLGAQLLLSEVLEYVIDGLGVTPIVNGQPITEPDNIEYKISQAAPDPTEMIDGLSDVAYTMYWNAYAFGIPLEEAFELVCDNNLEKFVELKHWEHGEGAMEDSNWHCNSNTAWPEDVKSVEVIKIESTHYAVGKDARGKVRKPAHFQPVDLSRFL